MEYLKLLKESNFKFDKAYGQNFITDTNLLKSIVADSGLSSDDYCLEIGTGAGTLTKEICKVAKYVTTVEIDKSLKPIHEQTLRDMTNLKIVYEDFLKLKTDDIVPSKDFLVIANIPYYITTPIIFKLLQGDILPKSITLMVQKEVANRIVAKQGSKDYGILSCVVSLLATVSIKRVVPASVFVPRPKVDSAIIVLKVKRETSYKDNIDTIRLIHNAFAMRRKTLVNNLISNNNIPKQQVIQALQQLSLDEKIRGEALSVQQFVQLACLLQSQLQEDIDK